MIVLRDDEMENILSCESVFFFLASSQATDDARTWLRFLVDLAPLVLLVSSVR